jgi:hypothetical protein
MKRKASIVVLLAGLAGGGGQALAGNYMGNVWSQNPEGVGIKVGVMPDSAGFVGPHGQPVQLLPAGQNQEPTGADYARAMLYQSFPNEVMQQVYRGQPGPSPFVLTGGAMPGPGGPGVPVAPGNQGTPPGAVAAIGGLGPHISAPYSAYRTEVRFVGPSGMKVSWYAPRPGGGAGFTAQYLEAPARYNFLQASIYRIKLSDIPNRPGLELYPTLEVLPATPRTATFLAHAAVPVNFTEEDFEQVAAGNFIVKVIYLPDPQFQDLAATGPDEVVSSRLEPGVDPIIEAKRRGSILAIVRLGNIDLEAPNTPAMDAPPPGHSNGMPVGPGAGNAMPPGAMNGMPAGPMKGMPLGMMNLRPGFAPAPVPGMPMMPGMPMPGMPMPPSMGAPTMPAMLPGAVPPAATVPASMPPSTPPARPVSQAAPVSPVQQASANVLPAAPAPAPPGVLSQPLATLRNGLADLLGRPTTER